MTLTDSIAGVASGVVSTRLMLILGAIALSASCLAGWALWRLAGAGPRCESRIGDARLAGNIAVSKLAAGQQAAIDAMRADQDAALIAAWAAQPRVVVRETTRWRTRWRDAGPAPACSVTAAQIDAINEHLK